jgi:hypothetical protein
MRGRITMRIATCCAIGVLSTILTSWACVWFGVLRTDRAPRPVRVWRSQVPSHWPPPERGTSSSGALLTGERRYFTEPRSGAARYGPSPFSTYIVDYVESGWPFRSMGAERWLDDTGASSPIGSGPSVLWTQGIADANAFNQTGGLIERRLPIRPLWVGFAANTLLWGAAFFALHTSMTIARARMRRRRGKCVNCGYPMSARPCPECGTA